MCWRRVTVLMCPVIFHYKTLLRYKPRLAVHTCSWKIQTVYFVWICAFPHSESSICLSTLHAHPSQKSFSARAVSRSHQRAEHILKNLQQEEEKRRLGREASIITAIPVAQEACYEPTCSPPPEQEEEGGAASHRSICYTEYFIYIYKYRRLVGIGKLCALMACCFSCICADRVGHWSRQQKKWWTWHRAVCLSAPPAPPVTPTGTILSVGAPCGLSAHWPAPKVGKWRIWDDENLYHNLTVCWFLK